MEKKPLTILISDDSLLIRKKLKDMLIEAGIKEVLEASNGQETIDLYKAHRPHIVLVDIIMPEKNGIEAIREIKSIDSNAYIIVVSSIGTKSKLKEAIEAGAHDFIQKPIQEDTILKLIQRYHS